MQGVAGAFELDFVLGEADFFNFHAAQGVGADSRMADGEAVLVEVDGIAEVAAAQEELLAYKRLLELVFGDLAGLAGVERGRDYWRGRGS